METFRVLLTFESANEVLKCDHSNETSSAALSHNAIYSLVFYKMKFGIVFNFDILGAKGFNPL